MKKEVIAERLTANLKPDGRFLLIFTLILAMLAISACGGVTLTLSTGETNNSGHDYELIFPSDRYPETALHIYGAIEQGHSNVCTIDRSGAEANRKESLAGIDTKKGFDRDEWPMAMCQEGGEGASVAYVASSDNRGAGSWVGHQLSDYPDGAKVLFVVEKPGNLFPDAGKAVKDSSGEEINKDGAVSDGKNVKQGESDMPSGSKGSKSEAAGQQGGSEEVVYANCAAVRAAGKAPLYKGDPGYSSKLDRDGDGVACQ
ncbi:excalibur calcium-binding domain-containing protein [Paenibacillus sp. CAU 1782]